MRGEGASPEGHKTPVVKAHCALVGRPANKAANCKLRVQFVGDYGICIRSKVKHDVLLHPVDLEF